ncbi:MAG: glycosyltransferase, partial [Agathobacter sp.]
INWLIFYPIEKICSYWTDVLITINKEDYAFAMKHMKAGRVEYISGVGIDVEEIYGARQNMEETKKLLGVSDRDIVLFSVGELSHRKNHEVIIHALKESNNPNIQYFICGQGELEKYLKDTIDNLELGKQVHLLGYRTDVYELYHAADIFVFPSYQEGLPVALMEAMASGLPVVVSRIRGNVDLIEEGKGGYLCEPDDVAGFISGIGDLVGDEESRIRFGEENRKKIAGFDVSIINDKMKKIYELVRI